ncbi:hypothetical protein Tco_0200958 [Tanacetum coccineum]
MVNTRSSEGGNDDNSGGLTDVTIIDLNNTMKTIQRSTEQMSETIRGLLLFQQFATGEINRISYGEGTSVGLEHNKRIETLILLPQLTVLYDLVYSRTSSSAFRLRIEFHQKLS